MAETRIWVIIPTFGRADILARLLEHLEGQERLPDHVLISAPNPSHVPAFCSDRFPVSHVYGGPGTSVQRNIGLEAAMPHADIITFFDDDFLPSSEYLQQVETCFAQHSDLAALMGHVVIDGACGPGLTFDEGLIVLRAAEASSDNGGSFADQPGAYGCNMSIRSSRIGTLRFDERLALYGWQEDIDFTGQLRGRGRVAKMTSLIGVHLGVKSGKVSGLRFGYSQIANPVYLIRKGTIPPTFAVKLMMRNMLANVFKTLWPEPYIDRAGRLKGNLIAVAHLLQGRVEPEHVLKMVS